MRKFKSDAQRRGFFGNRGKNQKGISERMLEGSKPSVKPKYGIVRPARFELKKKPKEKKITDTVGFNFGVAHYDHSEETTYDV